MKNNLAIIIPVYKLDFLDSALDSMAHQTCQRFNVYIGNDCSPYDIDSIVYKYKDTLNITYVKFDTNLGGKDLVAQWERCINLSSSEKWLWLFSDDDMMEPNCVELFYKQVENENEHFDVYHFDVSVIDEHNVVTKVPLPYPDVISAYQYYKDKMQSRILSLVVENIFSRDIWIKTQGFQHFDLAWGSDTATWVKFMQFTGMKSIRGAKVLWRCSDQNISPNNSKHIVERKINALISYYQWSKDFFEERNICVRWLNFKSYIKRIMEFRKYVSHQYVIQANTKFCKVHHLTKVLSFLNLYTRYL